VNLHPSELALLKDLSTAKDSWTASAADGISNPHSAMWIDNHEAWSKLSASLPDAESRDAFVAVVSELLSGLVHSMLVTLDGGSVLAETTLVSIQDDNGYEFKRFLHEFWPDCDTSGGA
jgi:hypothetical protein